ncbi:ubiquitin-protein ligase molybdopterin-converting factor [Xylaria bambusicola]|uniref:ubiquitin-protein ligase molybdopterin-converting factor n=1 Tax=Xylaria bambusicola TaxID=326684 RepID=UPI002007BFA2|nr:ubiquitin-protein ligase molybdopterin-converting factor [Xylaria bambusicola]KAI0522234.1 ubiquitin-protein ligase molybdopterin-converting factor [Xylaria bambusicola]
MASLLERGANLNPRVQLAATAIASGAVVATTILGFQKLQKVRRISQLKRSINSLAEDGEGNLDSFGGASSADKEDIRDAILARRAQAGDYDEELILEQLARNAVFLTNEGLDKLRDAFVIVVGCGGVGSHCTAALARSGVSRIRLIDFDQVSLSSLNRHAVATLADVGIPKVQCLRRRLLAIAPWVHFDLRQEKFWDEAAERLLAPWEETGQRPDFIVDAIDNIDTKVSLLKFCHDNKLPVISAMGAGCKSDPTRIVVGDIGTSTEDGLSRSTRRRLKLMGVTKGIPTVYSTEKTAEGKAELLPLPEEEFKKGQVGDLGVLPDFRVRILPVLGTMPAVFGYTVANHVILAITGYPHDYLPAKGREKMYDGLLASVQGGEEKMLRHQTGGDASISVGLKTPITTGDIAFLAEEIYKGRSVITGLTTRLVLTRWRKPTEPILIKIGKGHNKQKSSNLKLYDLVLMTKEEGSRHDKLILRGDKQPEDVYDPEVVAKVEATLKEIALYEKYR